MELAKVTPQLPSVENVHATAIEFRQVAVKVSQCELQ